MTIGTELITDERTRQVEVEGYTREHDLRHNTEALAKAAICYATPWILRGGANRKWEGKGWIPALWPWSHKSWKPMQVHSLAVGYWDIPSANARIRELVKAGALIAAEIDRLHNVLKVD